MSVLYPLKLGLARLVSQDGFITARLEGAKNSSMAAVKEMEIVFPQRQNASSAVEALLLPQV